MKQLYIKVGDVVLKGNSIEEMKNLAKIIETLPKSFFIRLGKLYARGHGKEITIVLLTVGLLAAGMCIFLNRKRIERLVKKHILPLINAAEEALDLPTSTNHPDNENVEDAIYEEIKPQPEESREPPKTWSENFLDEFGPMPELPPMLQFVVERSPAGYEVAMTVTLLCAFAALCFSKVRAKYLDDKVHAPNLQVLVEGNWGAGKDKFMTALNALFKRLFDRDKEKYSSSDEGMIIQWAGIGATESKFIDILANNGEVHVLMVSSEVLAVVNNMRKQNGLNAEYFRKAFDNGEVYRANKTKDIQGLFRVFMNCILTGTKGDTNMFSSKDVEGGTASRICWLEIPDSGRYLEALIIEDGEELERYRDQIEEWNRLYCYGHDESSGCDIPAEEHFIDLDYVNDAIKSWIDLQWLRANGDPDDPRVGARGRMGAIAFHCAMVIHMLFGCPGAEMAQTRRKVVELSIYLANHCMEKFLCKFGEIQKVQRKLNNQAEQVKTTSGTSQDSQKSSSQSDEDNYYGGFSKAQVRKMAEMHVPDIVGFGTIAKAFGLTGDTGRKTVERAIKKYRKEIEK